MTKIVSMSPLPAEFIQSMLESKGLEGIKVVNVTFSSPHEVKEELQDAEVVVGDFSFKNEITAETVALLKNAGFIQQPSVGYQHIDIEACAKSGIKVANCAGANTIDVAEYTVMSGIALMKKIMMSSRTTRMGEWRQMEIGPVELKDKTWGILGMGRIGKAVAERLYPFGVNMVYHDLTRLDEHTEKEMKLTYLNDINDLWENVDVLSLHCPLTPQTKNLINKDTIGGMKSGAVIINVARGEIVNEQDLADALQEGKLAGAAVDVFSKEPIKPDNPLLEVNADNLILSPHVAGVSEESKMRIMNMTIENLARFIQGKQPHNLLTD